ncbi:hypothetical protein POVCU1_022980 [Plasmodium ovale curtisi]|uniref:Uncharacterized protein n=1 Tax=Plasmodium ovale curtisi TaxID=864141 RepID=A0A1A8WHK2_PLAOA|nr:hypothetical protein POVCU1_022980 [Plasmodium ovale curtisi]
MISQFKEENIVEYVFVTVILGDEIIFINFLGRLTANERREDRINCKIYAAFALLREDIPMHTHMMLMSTRASTPPFSYCIVHMLSQSSYAIVSIMLCRERCGKCKS